MKKQRALALLTAITIISVMITGCSKNTSVNGVTKTESSTESAKEADKNTQNNIKDSENDLGESVKLNAVYMIDGTEENSLNESFESTDEDENVILVTNQGVLKISGANIKKDGDSTRVDISERWGLNAIFAVKNASTAEFYDSSLTSDAKGANAVFAIGEDTKISSDNLKIHTKGESSRGLSAVYGGSIAATNVDIITEGKNCAPISTGLGGGMITVNGGTLKALGKKSPCVYSTGDITLKNIQGRSQKGEVAVIEDNNFLMLEKCELDGAGENGISFCQGKSFNETEEKGQLSVKNSTITTESDGPMISICDTEAEATFENTLLNYKSGILVQVSASDADETESGGAFILKGKAQKFNGDVLCDKDSSFALELTDSSIFTGTVNGNHTGKNIKISLDVNSEWVVTGDSYVTVFADKDESLDNIISNGYTIYYDSSNEENDWLNSRTVDLSDGGKLAPQNSEVSK
ncbi:MAG: hypothetical protein ACI4S2_03280 [Lachnospiraceae bacterium]